MIRQPTIRSQQHKLQRSNSNTISQSGNSPLDLLALDVSPSAGNHVPLQAIVKSGYLLASAQRSPLEFTFKALLGILESGKFDFLQSQSISLKHIQIPTL
jgi:hypothetical protein